jgi:ribosomal protein S18 acetylase RimI-like enzyme
MGQIGVHKDYRGRGLVQMLYDKHREMYSSRYDFIITEIATRNTRSLRAHEKVGFKTIHHFTDETDDWDIVSWDWK